jgi:ribosomal protein S18 acetylase RimI-like enzyme
MLIRNNQLNDVQLQALETLAAQCKAEDGNLPSLYTHILKQERTTESNILYFQQDNLVGFLSVYFFYRDACEVTILVAPAYRRQGIAKRLLKIILPLLSAREMNTAIFSTAAKINEFWLSQLGFQYHHSEYHMQRQSYEPILRPKHALTIRKATQEDVASLCVIDELCFKPEHSNLAFHLTNLLHDSDYSLFIALHNDKAVGKAQLRWQHASAIVSDLAIMPNYQRQGWGSELLAYCINYNLTKGNSVLALDVETSNQNALNIYIRNGFKTINASDYWALEINKLRTLFNSC